MIEKFLETHNGRIYYWTEELSSDRPWVIFLHGLSSNHTTWDETLDLYKPNRFNIISVDLRGHGLSDKTRSRSLYTIARAREDVVKIIKQESASWRMNKVIVVGYSYGGYIGIDLALHHPELVEKLVLISTNHASQFIYHWSRIFSPVVAFLSNLVGWLMIWQSRKKYYYFNPKVEIGYWRSTFAGYATMPMSTNFWMLSEVFKMDYRNAIERIKCSTLIVVGAGDNFITEREINDMHRKIINSQVAVVGAGHFVATRFQRDTAEEIIKFLK